MIHAILIFEQHPSVITICLYLPRATLPDGDDDAKRPRSVLVNVSNL